MVYYPPPPAIIIYLLVVPYRTIFGRFSKKKIRMRAGPTHLPTSKVILDFWRFFNFASNKEMNYSMSLLVIKINFVLEFSCFCTFCAENDPGTTHKNWQQRFSWLEMYFGGNNHGCQEYSKILLFIHKPTDYNAFFWESGHPHSQCVT